MASAFRTTLIVFDFYLSQSVKIGIRPLDSVALSAGETSRGGNCSRGRPRRAMRDMHPSVYWRMRSPSVSTRVCLAWLSCSQLSLSIAYPSASRPARTSRLPRTCSRALPPAPPSAESRAALPGPASRGPAAAAAGWRRPPAGPRSPLAAAPRRGSPRGCLREAGRPCPGAAPCPNPLPADTNGSRTHPALWCSCAPCPCGTRTSPGSFYGTIRRLFCVLKSIAQTLKIYIKCSVSGYLSNKEQIKLKIIIIATSLLIIFPKLIFFFLERTFF